MTRYQRYEPGDRVRVTVPDPTDPDHQYHNTVGTVTEVREQPLPLAIGASLDDYLYRVEFDAEQRNLMWFRGDDLQRSTRDRGPRHESV